MELRPMTVGDLPSVVQWLEAEHVARWWLTDTSAATKIATYRERVLNAHSATTMLLASAAGRPVGFGQTYSWGSYPAAAAEVGAAPTEYGIDYALGSETSTGRGLGTALVAGLVDWVRDRDPGAGIVVDPDAANHGSRRVLEKNGFTLVVTPATGDGRAVYRLGSP